MTWIFFVILNIVHADNAKKTDMKSAMHQFYSTFNQLKPFFDEEEFKKESNRNEISSHIDKLIKDINESFPENLESTPGFRVSGRMLRLHLGEVQKGMKSGSYEYARYKLNATMGLCISCHARLPKGGLSKSPTFALKSQRTTFLQAEYQFLLKNFDTALALYNGLVSDYPKNDLKQPDLYKSMERKLAIFTRIKRDPQGALASFEVDIKKGNLPADLVHRVRTWIQSLKKWQDLPENLDDMSDQKLVERLTQSIETILKTTSEKKHDVEMMRYSGVLYQKVFSNPDSKSMPEMLYLLSLCEDYLDKYDDLSLALIYQKECVIKYPKHPVARKCFENYRDSLTTRYGPLPKFLRDGIKALEERL